MNIDRLVAAVVCSISLSLASCCNVGTTPKYGNMSQETDIEVGSSLSVKCTLFSRIIARNETQYYVTSENLVIKVHNTFLQKLKVIDDYTVQYTVPNASVSDTGVYSCYLSIPELSFNPFVCTTKIVVGYKPLPAQNFSCISYGYTVLNCTWKNPPNPVKTNYTLKDYYMHKKAVRVCPISTNESCMWSMDTIPPYMRFAQKLNFILTGMNPLGTITQEFSLDHYQIVKPSHPMNVMFRNVTKNSLYIHWLPPQGMEYGAFPPGVNYWIHYCPTNGTYPELCAVINASKEESYFVQGLIPHMEYIFRIRCRASVVTRDDMWSEFYNVTVQTEPDIPYLAPESEKTSFEVVNVQYKRNIILYWKAIPSQFENGDQFQYVIQYHVHYVNNRYKREVKEVNTTNTSYKFRSLDSDTAYLFKITARNSAGYSRNYSVIIVDKSSKLLRGPTHIAVISHGQGNYSLSWQLGDITPVPQTFTIFWCQDVWPRPFPCAGPIDWLTTTNTNISLNLLDGSTNYQFAVSSNVNESTSGMKWARCIIPYSGVLYKVNKVELTPKNSTSITVRWVLDCDTQNAVIEEYNISYCPEAACLDNKNYIIIRNNNTLMYIVGGLHPFTKYKFVVLARTKDGWSGESDAKIEKTMSEAPTDPPQHVNAFIVNDTVIRISFHPPTKPNGIISRYHVLYGQTGSLVNEKHQVDYIPDNEGHGMFRTLIDKSNVYPYTNYSIQVKACVNMLCSPPSTAVYVKTGIAAPGLMDPPRVEVINSSFVNISWAKPDNPNGPIDVYYIGMFWQNVDEEDGVMKEIFNVSGHDNSLTIDVLCDEQLTDGRTYYFQVQAGNVKNGTMLHSLPSSQTQSRLCFISPAGMSYLLIAGLIIGISCGMSVFAISVFILVKWMKKKFDIVKNITVQLPSGLDSPIDNPLNSYDKFKSGLQKNLDSGIPSERTYERLCSYASDKGLKDLDISCDISSNECLHTKIIGGKSGRNRSGDSNASSKYHDSISSSNTTKTHLSIDSGADTMEHSSPPSPDTMFSDSTSSSNTTPRSYKPELEIVQENNSNSRDSGLEKGTPDKSQSSINNINPGIPYYINKDNQSNFNTDILQNMDHMQPYSKFAIIAPAFAPKYVSVGPSNFSLIDQQSLANSEPSVADAVDDDSEPLMQSGVPPYCKFGIARSASNGMNILNQLPQQPNLGYSKFGIIYGSFGNKDKPQNKPTKKMDYIQNYSRFSHPYVMQHPTTQKLIREPLLTKKTPNNTSINSSVPQTSKKLGNGYVSFNQAMESSNNTEPQQSLVIAPSDVVLSMNNTVQQSQYSPLLDPLGDDIPAANNNPNTLNCPQQSKPKGYVSFHDAKLMADQEETAPKEADSTSDNKCIQESHQSDNADTPVSINDQSQIMPNSDPVYVGNALVNDDNVSKPDATVINEQGYAKLNNQSDINVSDDVLEENIPLNHEDMMPNGGNAHNNQRTFDKVDLSEANKAKPKVNGYVSWTELLTSDKPANGAEIILLPRSIGELDIENV